MTGLELGDVSIGDALTAAVAGFFMWLVARTKAKSGSEDTATPAQQMIDQIQAWADKRLAQSEEWTQQRLAERDEKINKLDKRVTSLESRYQAALRFIRTLLRRHPDSSDDIPAEIRHDL